MVRPRFARWRSAGGSSASARQSSPRSISCCGARDSLLHRTRRGAACLGSARQWPAARKGRQLAHPSRVRLGESVWRHWLEGLGERHTLVRYDERGCGLSDREAEELSLERWVADLETVIDAAGLDRFVLLGISQGAATAIAYSVRHPDRVDRLVLYGGYARGRGRRGEQQRERLDALISAIRTGWADPDPTFRRLFTMLFLPQGSPEQMAWYDELQRRSTSAETAVRLYRARAEVDVRELASRVTAKTLVAHARGDRVVPFEEGRILASLLPTAKLVPLESVNHILLRDEPAWTAFLAEVHAFLGASEPTTPAELAGPQQSRAGGPRARRGGTEQRRDRIAPVRQRPNGRAPPLEHLREAACLREGGARGGGRSVRARARVLPAARHLGPVAATCMPPRRPTREAGSCVVTPMRGGRMPL